MLNIYFFFCFDFRLNRPQKDPKSTLKRSTENITIIVFEIGKELIENSCDIQCIPCVNKNQINKFFRIDIFTFMARHILCPNVLYSIFMGLLMTMHHNPCT